MRYIYFDAASNFLQLAQVAVYGQDRKENLAFKKRTCSSLHYENCHEGYPVDGMLKARPGDEIYHSADSQGCYWYVDLGAEYKVDKIVFYNRVDCNERAKGYVITALDESWTIQYRWKVTSEDLEQEFSTRTRGAFQSPG